MTHRTPPLHTINLRAGVGGQVDLADDPGESDVDFDVERESLRLARPSGPDVSDFQRNINWDKVRAAGHTFAVAKATEGMTWKAETFPGRWRAIRKAGLIPGAYHFARPQPGRSGADEARAFLRVVDAAGGFQPGDLRPVLDLETSSGLKKEQILRFATEFVQAVKQQTGVNPIIYTGVFWRDTMGDPSDNLGCRLWLAAYVKDPTPYVPRAWAEQGWSMWQYTSKGTCPGITGRCDLNVVRDADTLAKLRIPTKATS